MPVKKLSVWKTGWLAGLPWARTLRSHPVDPYLLWALATTLRDFGRDGQLPGVLNLIAELEEPLSDSSSTAFFARLNHRVPPARRIVGAVPSAYFEPYPGSPAQGTRYITLRLDLTALPAASAGPRLAEWLCRLTRSPLIRRLQLGQARGGRAPDGADGAASAPAGGGQRAPRVLLAAIEDTCPFLHRALRAAAPGGGTRVSVLWDQSVLGPQGSPRRPDRFGYGRQWRAADLDRFAAPMASGAEAEDLADVWERLAADRGSFASLRPRASHGASVLGLLAGRWTQASLPASGVLPGEGADWQPVTGGTDDAASTAPLAVVQLPREQTQVSSGRWLAPHLLDALRYLLCWGWSHSTAAPGACPLPLVATVSYGSQTGPHDGSGILECAMEEMSAAYGSDLALVLAAGNSAGTARAADDDACRVPSGVHGQGLLDAGSAVRFALRIPPDKQTETALEIWFDRRLAPGERLTVRLWKPASRRRSGDLTVTLPGAQWQSDSTGQVVAGLVALNQAPQGLDRALALVMVTATEGAGRCPQAPAGEWQIEVRSGSPDAAPLRVDLWVERDDTVVGAVRGQQARLRALDAGTLTDADTFSHIASGAAPLVVTALEQRDAAGSVAAATGSRYASRGTVARPADLSALVDPLRTAHGMRVMGNHTGVVLRANGSSLAAPQAARWVAQQLEGGATLAGIRGQIAAAGPNARVGKVVP